MASRGGARAGAGRKSNAEIAKFREMIDRAVGEGAWLKIIKAAAREAQSDGKAAGMARQFLASYRWGLPTQLIREDDEAAPIRLVRIVPPADYETALRTDSKGVRRSSAQTSNASSRRKRKVHPDAGGDAGRQDQPGTGVAVAGDGEQGGG